jgi:outer membrane protein TolC
MRWKTWCAGLSLLLAVAGCKQQCYMTLEDSKHYQDLAMSETNLECTTTPTSPVIDLVGHAPPTVINPERNVRYLSLAEAIAVALEQGNTGQQFITFNQSGSPINGGQLNETPVSFLGGARLNSDNIRVLSIDPSIAGTTIEESLTKFDANLVTSGTWQAINRPVGNVTDTIQANGTTSFIETSAADVRASLVKPMPTGGTVGITLDTAYQFTNLPARVNPSYTPSITFAFEQPLLQGYGVEINQLRAVHPGSIANQNLQGLVNTQQPSPEGIVISRVRFDEQRAEFERNVTVLVTNVEIAYWRLYGSYWTLYSREAAMRQSYEAWKLAGAKYAGGKINRGDLAQARGQYELFRGQRIDALDTCLENERVLRGLMGMHVEDGHRLVPSDAPTLAPYQPDWQIGLQEALDLRPELYIARQEVKVNQLNLKLQKDNLLPDVRFIASYDVNSLGNRLDGPDQNNAFRNLADAQFHNWTVGFQGRIPLGFRLGNANVRIARLNLARSFDVLQQEELKTERFLAVAYRQLDTNYEKIRALRAQREAFAEQLDTQFRIFQAGKGTLDILLEAQRFWADALNQEYQAIITYQQNLAIWEYAKGTILKHDNVMIAEGGLPTCVAGRAVENERKRTMALVAKERPSFGEPNGCSMPSLPALWKTTPPMNDAPSTTAPTDASAGVGAAVTTQSPAQNLATPTAAPTMLPALPSVPVKPAKPSDLGAVQAPASKPTFMLPAMTPSAPPAISAN